MDRRARRSGGAVPALRAEGPQPVGNPAQQRAEELDLVLGAPQPLGKRLEAGGGHGQVLPGATILTFDFAVGDLPAFKAGTNRVTLENRGKQIHELDLVALPEGKTVQDLVAWAAEPAGPPPARFLGGPAIRHGLSATTSFELEAGRRYAIVCIIPDGPGDRAPHITKGMYSPEFQVTP